MLRTVYMGTPEFAVPCLRALAEEKDIEVALVVTQPDRKGNRGKITMSPVKKTAMEYGIPVAQPFSIRKNPEFVESLRELSPDIIVVAAFGQILPEQVLNIPRYGCVNLHGSLLPELRGAAPMQYAIMEGHQKTGITLMKMDKGLDTGDMLAVRELEIGDKDIDQVAESLSVMGAELLMETLPAIVDGTVKAVPQDDSKSTYAHMIKKTDGLTDFSGSAAEEERKLRAFKDWPVLHSYLNGQTVKFYKAQVIDLPPEGDHGTIAKVDKDSFQINCGSGRLKILELQLQGKKRMKTEDFLRGRKLEKGDRFTTGQHE